MLQGYAAEVESQKHSRDTPSSFSGHMGAGLGPRHYTVHLRAVLLLQFMEHLDKLMYNAYEGSCVTLPPVPKVREKGLEEWEHQCDASSVRALLFLKFISEILIYCMISALKWYIW